MKPYFKNFIFVSIAVLFLNCEGSDGPAGAAGLNSLVNMTDEPLGDNCPNGGVKIDSGLDLNADGTLADAEVQDTKYVCDGEAGDPSSKEIRIEIFTDGEGTSATSFELIGKLEGFDKTRFSGVDSIVLSANPWARMPSDDPATSFIDLYNMTDDEVVANSELSISQLFSEYGFGFSANVYSSLPEKEITLGVRMRVASGDNYTESRATTLILFRND